MGAMSMGLLLSVATIVRWFIILPPGPSPGPLDFPRAAPATWTHPVSRTRALEFDSTVARGVPGRDIPRRPACRRGVHPFRGPTMEDAPMTRTRILLATVLAAIGTAVTSASPPDTRISGGGTATFDSAEGGTIFSVQARIDADGTARGHFMCAIPGVVVIIGDDLTEATINDDGSITLAGFGHGYDAAVGVYTDLPFEVRLWPGGPGVGRFIYDDPVAGTPAVDTDTEGDHETVATGHIMF